MLTQEQIDSIERPPDVSDAEWARLLILAEHPGRWVAWAGDFVGFVAAGDTPQEALAQAKRAGVDDPLLEWVHPPDARPFPGFL